MPRVASESRPGVSHDQPAVLTICGSGNAGHALAVAASQNFHGWIDWLVIRTEERARLLRRRMSEGALRSTGVVQGTAHRVRTISRDPAEVIPDADMVLIAVPAFAHALVLQRIRPHIGDGAILGCLPTRGGFEFEAAELVPRGGTRRKILGLQTLPWSTRVVTPGEHVNIGAVKAEVLLASLPAADGPSMAARLGSMLGTRIAAVGGFLSLTLGNTGQVIHPGLMYGHFRSWRGEEYDRESIPKFYADVTDDIGEMVEGLSDDAVAVARSLEDQSGGALNLEGVLPIHAWLRSSYAHVTEDTSTVASCFRTGPIQARLAPMTEVRPGTFVPNFDYRYLTEDVPFGLVVTRALAQLANVKTPAIDEVISWAQSAMKKEYLVAGTLDGPDVQHLPIPQAHGISTVSELVQWYGAEASGISGLRVPSRSP